MYVQICVCFADFNSDLDSFVSRTTIDFQCVYNCITMVNRGINKSWGQAQWQPSESWNQSNYGNDQQQWRGEGSPNSYAQDDYLDQQPAARGETARELQERLGDARAGRPQFLDAQDQQPVTQVQQAPGLLMEPLVDTEHIEFMAFSEDDTACDPLVNTEHFDLTP